MENLKPFLRSILDGLAVEYADIRVEENERTAINYRGRELDEIGRAFDRGGCIRAFSRGNWASAKFNIVDDSLADLARDLAGQVEALPEKDGRLHELPAFDDVVTASRDDDPRSVPLGEKQELIHGYNEILLKTPGVTSTMSVYGDKWQRLSFLSTEDRFISQERVYTGFFCMAIARDGANVQRYSDTFGRTQGFATLRNREALVERIGRVAVDLLKAEPVRGGTYTVIIDQELAGVFAHEAFGHLSEADTIADNDRLRALMKPGTRFGVDELAIIDDATLPGERGSYRFDDEGAAGERTELIKNGVLVGRLHDRQTAAKMGEAVTGNARAMSYRHTPIVRMSNTYIEPRDVNIEEMMDGVEDGLYVSGSQGGNTELESFTFAAKYAWRIEHGRKTGLLRDVTLSGNVFETMKNIDAVGDDLVILGGMGMCGKGGQAVPVGLGGPHLRIRNVVIGGR
jgi:TldD protein